MALNNDQITIREYLLGKLSEDEQQKIEERLMTENDLFQEFEISKGELVEEYLANELSGEEHEWFEGHFLSARGDRVWTSRESIKQNEPNGEVSRVKRQ